MPIGQKDQQLLLKVQLLSGIPERVLPELTKEAFVQGLPKGTILFDRGDSAQFLHVALTGRVAITSAIAERETIIVIRDAGEAILDPALILGVPYATGARLIEGGRIMMIPAQRFREIMTADAATAAVTLQALAETSLTLTRHIRDLKLLTTIQRLARHLLSMIDTTSGTATLTLRDDRPVLAALLGMTPESLSRAFAHLRTIGVNTDKSGSISVENVRKLRSLSKLEERIENEARPK